MEEIIDDETIMKLFEVHENDYVILDELEIRHERIQKINQDVGMINEIYKDLYYLVYGQQEAIDKIENNIDEATENVENAESELVQAEIYQKKSYKKHIVLSSILIAGVSTPIGVVLGLKTAIVTASCLGISSLIYSI